MAERYKSTSESKLKMTRNKIQKGKSRDTKKRLISESKTPPLPPNCSASIEELMKQRETIRDELQIISKYKEKKTGHKTSPHKRKRQHEHFGSKSKKTETHESRTEISLMQNLSPENNLGVTHLDSEDEENIIEQRRKQRKLLLAQLQEQMELKDSEPKFSEDTQKDLNHIEKQTKLESTQNNLQKIKNVTDMFSEDDFLNSNNDKDKQNNGDTKNNEHLTDNWDDEEGYFKINIGDSINKYTIIHLFGQGVFSNVIKAQETGSGKKDVAIKIVRNNDLMYKTGLKEIAYLKEINKTDPEDKYHCVRLLSHFMHKGHLCLVLECFHMDLRNVLKKYGKKHGINLKAVMSYSRQLFLALRHLKKIGIIHADIKPDNIIVNEKKNILKLCDFGSATKENYGEPTPYLVSRFYRAPEVILGIPYTFSIDMWSAACTIYEMTTGKILFTGGSNNKMIKCFMDLKGKIPNRLLRKSKFKDQHFNYNSNFLLHKVDEFTGREKVVEISNISITRDLYKELLKSYKTHSPYEEKKIGQLKELLEKMLMLDANHRLSITDCLKHVFIQEDLQR